MAVREQEFHRMERDRVSLVDSRETCVSLTFRVLSALTKSILQRAQAKARLCMYYYPVFNYVYKVIDIFN